MTAAALLKARALGYRVGRAELLSDISLRIAPGRVTALLGPNGAGKSTLLSLLSGQKRPSTGQVLLGDRALSDWSAGELARVRAVMQQQSAVAFDFRARDIVALGRHPHQRRPGASENAIVAAALASADVAHLAGRNYTSLSGGEQARVQLARVLAQLWEPCTPAAPRWLLLDEPTAALDWAHQMQLMATVRRWAHEQGAGVVVVLHDLNLALRYADEAVVLAQGRLVDTGPCGTLLTPALVERVWHVRCRRVESGDATGQLVSVQAPSEPRAQHDAA